jgi:CRISPR-associated protein Cas6/Cse3/CasE subtype I-E
MNKYVLKNFKMDESDVYLQHQQITACFSGSEHVRYRKDGNTVTVYSTNHPTGNVTCKMSTVPTYVAGTVGEFKVRLNMEKRKFVKGGDGPREAVRDLPSILKKLNEIAGRSGFVVKDFQEVSEPYILKGTQSGNKIAFNTVDFVGVLEVTDQESFKNSLDNGIGSGKAFGLGLLIFTVR